MGVYSTRVPSTTGPLDALRVGMHINLEGLPVRVTSITVRPIEADEMDDWSNSSPDDRIVTISFTDTSKPRGDPHPAPTPDPEPLPETDPRRIEWVKRIMSRQINDGGAPLPSVRQVDRPAPRYEAPWIERREG